jgi:hypothetical protein
MHKSLELKTVQVLNIVLVVALAATLLLNVVFMSSSLMQLANAQQPTQPQSQLQHQQKESLNFFLKLANNASTAQAASQAVANGTGTKNMSITVNIQKDPGDQQMPILISAMVPANIQPQDLQLCTSLTDGSESCQPLSGESATVDLTLESGATAGRSRTGMAGPMPAPAPAPAPAPPTG